MKTQTRNGRYVELLDTTLRDGEQTPGVAFTPAEKFEIARILISHLRIDRLEIGSARVSDGEREALAAILKWAEHRGSLDRMESYRAVHGPIMRAIMCLGKGAHLAPDLGEKHDRATLQCFVSPSPNDVIASDGIKLAGAAQRRTRKGILHQGSVSLNASDSGRSPIVDAIRRAFAGELGFIYEPFPVPDFLLKDAEQLARRKYATDAWNVEKVAPC